MPSAGDGFETEAACGPAAELRGGVPVADEASLTGSVRAVFALPDGGTAVVSALGLEWRL